MSRLHKPKAGFWIRTWVSLLYPLDGLFFRIRYSNLDRIPAPAKGGVIIAVNHTSQMDTILMARMVWQSGRVPRFMIKAGVFGWPIVGFMMKGAGQIPVYRGTADATQSLRDAVSALDRGEAIVIYPEGTTTKDPANWPMQAKTGIEPTGAVLREVTDKIMSQVTQQVAQLREDSPPDEFFKPERVYVDKT
jgi:1-acyl-sn-glycerol-3-phosphate acyltransferase